MNGGHSALSMRESVEITNQRGLHARASAKFVNMVTMLPEDLMVTVNKDGTEAVGGSILGLISGFVGRCFMGI